MARFYTAGAEIVAPDSSGNPMDMGNFGSSARDTTVFRSGLASYKYDSGAGNSVCYTTAAVSNADFSVLLPANQTSFIRSYMRFANAPTSAVDVLAANTGSPNSSNGISARLTTGGKLQLRNVVAGTQIGSDSVDTLATDGSAWYRIEIMIVYDGSKNITSCELRLDGITVASASGVSIASGSGIQTGWLMAPGANKVCNVDDFAVNDASGTVQNSWCGEGKIVLLKPTSLNTNGGSWTDDNAATTSAALANAIDNTPPNGIADTTAGGGNHQVRNAGANSNLDMNMTDYTTAGLAATDTVKVVLPIVMTAAPVSTQAKSGSVGLVSNPAITNKAFVNGTGTATFFWGGAAASTWPLNWKSETGTITYNPSVTLGTSPVMRLSITGGSTSRVAMCCFMGIYVEYSPSKSDPTEMFQQRRRTSRRRMTSARR